MSWLTESFFQCKKKDRRVILTRPTLHAIARSILDLTIWTTKSAVIKAKEIPTFNGVGNVTSTLLNTLQERKDDNRDKELPIKSHPFTSFSLLRHLPVIRVCRSLPSDFTHVTLSSYFSNNDCKVQCSFIRSNSSGCLEIVYKDEKATNRTY